jgi:hypothetical protein
VVSSGGNQVKLWSTGTTSASPHVVPTLTPLASSDPIGATEQDQGFLTSVSSNGLTANSAVIWAVARPEGADNHVTLLAFDGTPSGQTLPQLWSGVAGFWPNIDGNANLVPTLVDGHVFVPSNKQVQIFGLLGSNASRHDEPFQPSAFSEAPAHHETGAQFWGTIRSMEGQHMTLELRTGRVLQVDRTPAIREGRSSAVSVGQLVLLRGKMNSNGTFAADTVIRAKGKSLWGEDRDE